MLVAPDITVRPIDEIEVGKRFRKELGDLRALIASIEEVGLLHPVVITTDGKLLAGARRLKAVQKMGWLEVPVMVADNVTDATKELLAERDENTCRKDMKPSEAARLGMAIEALDEKQREANRLANLQQARNRRKGLVDDGKPNLGSPLGEATKVVGPAVGMSHGTYEKARVIVKLADDPTTPVAVREAARDAMEGMDRTGKVTPNWKKLNQVKKAQPPPGEHATWDKTSQRYKDVIAKIIKGVWDSLTRFDVAAPALAKVDMEVLMENLSDDELEDMLQMAETAVKELKVFQQRLREYKPTQETQ